MKIQNMAIIFIIIILPITLLLSAYTKMQIDAISIQTQYATKLRDATYDAVSAFQLNTADNKYSSVSDSMRRDVNAAVQTFITSIAKNFGMSGSTDANIKPYIPALVFTLYDGYYIYAPSFAYADLNKENENVVNGETGYSQTSGEFKRERDYLNEEYDDQGNVIEEKWVDNVFKINDTARNYKTEEVIDSIKVSDSKTEKFEHVLKPFIYYTARYKNDTENTDVIINYTLDNYIVVYGKVQGVETTNAGYLELNNNVKYSDVDAREKLFRRYPVTTIVHNKDIIENQNENKSQNINKNLIKKAVLGERLMDVCVTGVDLLYDRYTNSESLWVKFPDRKMLDNHGESLYQDVTYFPENYIINEDQFNNVYSLKTNKEHITFGVEYNTGWYVGVSDNNDTSEDYYVDPYSAAEYYDEAYEFTKWVDKYLGNISASDAVKPNGEKYVNNGTGKIFDFFKNEEGRDPIVGNDPTRDDSIFNEHKREVIKTSIEDNLEQAITTYNHHSGALGTEYYFKMPVLTETEWDKVLKNVCMISFIEGLQAGTKIYNDYAIVTSTKNKEYVSPNEIYYINEKIDENGNPVPAGDGKYHKLGCSQLIDDSTDGTDGTIVGYKSSDFDKQYYEYEDFERYPNTDSNAGKIITEPSPEYPKQAKEDTVRYYTLHEYEACYYCMVNSTDKVKEVNVDTLSAGKQRAYVKALAREKYNFYKANTYLRERKTDFSNPKGASDFNIKNYTLENVTMKGDNISLEVRVPHDAPNKLINGDKPNVENLSKYPLVIIMNDENNRQSNIDWKSDNRILNEFRNNDYALCIFNPDSANDSVAKSRLKYVVYYMSQKDYVDSNNIFIIGANNDARNIAESVYEFESKVKAIVLISPYFQSTDVNESWDKIFKFKKSVLLLTGRDDNRNPEYDFAEKRINSVVRQIYNGSYNSIFNITDEIISNNGSNKGIIPFLKTQRRNVSSNKCILKRLQNIAIFFCK